MPVIVFDLDDTLYDEMTYVTSGFRAVAEFLEPITGTPEDILYQEMMSVLSREGRGQVFDAVLRDHGCHNKSLARKCVSVYRAHRPSIRLFRDAERLLNALASYPIYIVTDGNKHVQFRKLEALALLDHPNIRGCYITRRFGIRNEKPSPHCFHLICQREGVDPSEVVYIGDNPNKDFVGIKPLGFRTIRVVRGSHAAVRRMSEFEAELTVSDLTGLDRVFTTLFHRPYPIE